MPDEENLHFVKILKLLKVRNCLLKIKEISNSVGYDEQHTRRIKRHFFSEELLIRNDQKNNND